MMAKTRARQDPVGIVEVADRLGFPVRTVHQWRWRGILPPADFASINASEAWEWATILVWAGESGRLDRRPELAEDYRRLVAERARQAAAEARQAATDARARKGIPSRSTRRTLAKP